MKLWVVTVVKNDFPGLKKTERSVLSQSIEIDWMIVTPSDRSSTAHHASQLLESGIAKRLVVDNGGGIYPAMNLAMQALSPTEWVWYLNAGDEFATNKTYEFVKREINRTQNKWVFGGHKLGSDEGEILGEIPAPKQFKKASQLFAKKYVSHQAVIFQNSFLQELGGFKAEFKVAADWDLLTRAAENDGGQRLDEVLVVFYMGGISTANRSIGNHELFELRKKHLTLRYQPKNYLWYLYRSVRNGLVRSIELKYPSFANLIRRIRLIIKS